MIVEKDHKLICAGSKNSGLYYIINGSVAAYLQAERGEEINFNQ